MRCSGPSLPPPSPHLRNCSEVPKASHLPVTQRGFRAGPVSGPSHPPCVLWAFLCWGEGSRPGELGLLIGPGSQGTPVGTCPAVSVGPACGGSTARSKSSETRRTRGGSGGGSPAGKRHSGDGAGGVVRGVHSTSELGPACQWLLGEGDSHPWGLAPSRRNSPLSDHKLKHCPSPPALETQVHSHLIMDEFNGDM